MTSTVDNRPCCVVYIVMVHCADNLIVLGRLAGQQTGFNRKLKAKVVYVRIAVQWTSLAIRVCHAVKCNEFKSLVNEAFFSLQHLPVPPDCLWGQLSHPSILHCK
jgi:hypothetical protein